MEYVDYIKIKDVLYLIDRDGENAVHVVISPFSEEETWIFTTTNCILLNEIGNAEVSAIGTYRKDGITYIQIWM